MISLNYERTIPLWHSAQCRLLGISPTPYQIYAEEVYGEGSWVAQYAFSRDGILLESTDEADGENPDASALALPNGLKAPSTGWISMVLNHGGIPSRGLVREERVIEMVKPFKTAEKQLLIERGYLADLAPEDVLGLAGSFVISEGKLSQGLYLLVRQLRVAVRLPEVETGEDDQPFDYITYDFPVLQSYLPNEPERSLNYALMDEGTLGVMITCPTDCIVRDDLLVISDAGMGDAGRVSAIHLWQIEADEPPSEADKLYGTMDGR